MKVTVLTESYNYLSIFIKICLLQQCLLTVASYYSETTVKNMSIIWSLHSVLFFSLFPSISVWSIFLGILSSAFDITCPNHLNLLF